MDANYYLEQIHQDMRLRAYSEHTQDVYGRAVRCFLDFNGKSAEALNEPGCPKLGVHLITIGNGILSKFYQRYGFKKEDEVIVMGLKLYQQIVRWRLDDISKQKIYMGFKFSTYFLYCNGVCVTI